MSVHKNVTGNEICLLPSSTDVYAFLDSSIQ